MNYNRNFEEPPRVIKRADAPEVVLYGLTFKEAFTNYFRTRFSAAYLKKLLRSSFPVKGDTLQEIIRKGIRAASFVLLMTGLIYIVFHYAGYRERIKDFGQWEIAIDSIEEEELFDFQIAEMWADIKEQYPDVDFPEGMALRFADLYAVNQDAVGVLRIPELELFTPLLRNRSSPDYYLWKNIYGDYSRYGNPYMDYRCSISEGNLSKNTIIYGHNTHDKLGFNKLTDYMSISGYRKAPVVTLETLYEKTRWKVFAVILTNSTSAADRGHLFRYLIPDFSTNAEFMELIDGIEERSMIRTEVEVEPDDKILTLYTCYQNIFEGGRLVVFARLLRDGESADVDVSKAYFNDEARYPQAYYDQKGLTNPWEKLTEPIVLETDKDGNWVEVTTDADNKGASSEKEKTTKKSGEKTTKAEETTKAP